MTGGMEDWGQGEDREIAAVAIGCIGSAGRGNGGRHIPLLTTPLSSSLTYISVINIVKLTSLYF